MLRYDPATMPVYEYRCRDCGHEFGDYRVNWKMEAHLYCRRTEEEIRELANRNANPLEFNRIDDPTAS